MNLKEQTKPMIYMLTIHLGKYVLKKGAKGDLNWPIENIIDVFSDVRPQSQELSIDPVEGSFEEVSLSGILTVK